MSAAVLKPGPKAEETALPAWFCLEIIEDEFWIFWLNLKCLQRLDDLQNWHHFQTVLDNVCNFAVAYSRALVSLLYFFTSSFGFLLGLYCSCFCSFCQLERQFFSVGTPKT